MSDDTTTRLGKFIRSLTIREIRLSCGIVLFSYVLTHLLNHALGNISLDALAVGAYYHTLFWQFPPVAILFYSAAIVHCGLGLWALYDRRQLRWTTIDPLQLVLGLSIPSLIIAHIVGVRLGQIWFQTEKLYPQVFYAYWVAWPEKMWLMFLVLNVAWIHGCIGLYFWLRIKSFFRRLAPYLFALAILVPTLAMLGLYQGGRTVVQESASAEWQAKNIGPSQMGSQAQQDTLADVANYSLIGYLGLIVLALAGRGIRALADRRGGTINLSYGNGRTVRVPRGLTVLEASLRNRLPHASACGGRARCSTCRIRVIGDSSALPAPSKRESLILNRVGAGADPSIRLACQLRPNTDLSFFQIFQPQDSAALHASAGSARRGQERYLVSMFVDMRNSTRLAEGRLPFDTVFIVNRFLGAVSRAVIACGGQPNQFVGDGMLALFGLATTPAMACRQALSAAVMIAANVDDLNRFLEHDLREPIRFGIGIHGGEVIVGDIGYRDHMVFTALGDSVNVAARLQDMTKATGCEAILSEEVRTVAAIASDALPAQTIIIRGRAEPMTVRIVADAKILTALVARADGVAA